MPQRADTDDYRALFLSDTPFMDTRAPVEFVRGAFPHTVNLPLMNDEQRHEVGICYKEHGQAAAIALGHSLVSGDLREQRMQGWRDFAAAHPTGYLYCFRGGLRSQTVQQWLREAGVDYPLVRGGYKAMRRFLLSVLEQQLAAAPLALIAGMTGSGKTRVVHAVPRSIDLEGLARHRGSTFGQLPGGQPSQIDFENALGIAVLRALQAADKTIWLEDEGRLIGRVALPELLRQGMEAAPMVVVEESLESRVSVLVEDYIDDLGQRMATAYGADGPTRHRDKLQDDLNRVRKRLGGVQHTAVSEALQGAFDAQWRSGDVSEHRVWIGLLLQHYYDPMYRYQLDKRAGQVLFRGSRAAVIDWLRERP